MTRRIDRDVHQLSDHIAERFFSHSSPKRDGGRATRRDAALIYDIRHKTTFTYEEVVSVSHHVLHLAPRRHARQRASRAAMRVDPRRPSSSGRPTTTSAIPFCYLTVQEPHERLVVDARSRVEVRGRGRRSISRASPAWERCGEQLGGVATRRCSTRISSRSTRRTSSASEDVRDYALQSFAPGRPILDAAMDLTGRIFREFEYRGGVSDVSTPVRDVFAMRKGVCQDFAHLEIACLRSLGLAARYVSGYLLTHPPEGKEKLVGSDASHAWLSVWSPASWLGRLRSDEQHDPGRRAHHVAWGRDYGDVSPINGFIVGGGAHQVAVAVDVNRLASQSSHSAGTPRSPAGAGY